MKNTQTTNNEEDVAIVTDEKISNKYDTCDYAYTESECTECSKSCDRCTSIEAKLAQANAKLTEEINANEQLNSNLMFLNGKYNKLFRAYEALLNLFLDNN